MARSSPYDESKHSRDRAGKFSSHIGSEQAGSLDDETVAASDEAVEETLDELSYSADPADRQFAAENPRTRPSTLRDLARGWDDAEVKQSLVRNPNVPVKALTFLSCCPHPSVRRRAVRHSHISSRDLRFAASDPDPIVRSGVADNPNTSSSTLVTLASDPDPNVRFRVAQNANLIDTPAQRLLAQDSSSRIRQAVTSNRSADASVLHRLSGDPEAVVRMEVAVRTTWPRTLRGLAEDPHPAVRISVAENPRTPRDTLERLAGEDSSVGESAREALD